MEAFILKLWIDFDDFNTIRASCDVSILNSALLIHKGVERT